MGSSNTFDVIRESIFVKAAPEMLVMGILFLKDIFVKYTVPVCKQ